MSERTLETIALSILDHIHRTFTAASTREAAHTQLAKYNQARFHTAMKKYNKSLKKANRYAPNSVGHDNHMAQAMVHLNTAEHHDNMLAHHAKKAFAASSVGYDVNKQLRKRANELNYSNATNRRAFSSHMGDVNVGIKNPKHIHLLQQKPEIFNNKTPKPISNTVSPVAEHLQNMGRKEPRLNPAKPFVPAKPAKPTPIAGLRIKAKPNTGSMYRPSKIAAKLVE